MWSGRVDFESLGYLAFCCCFCGVIDIGREGEFLLFIALAGGSLVFNIFTSALHPATLHSL